MVAGRPYSTETTPSLVPRTQSPKMAYKLIDRPTQEKRLAAASMVQLLGAFAVAAGVLLGELSTRFPSLHTALPSTCDVTHGLLPGPHRCVRRRPLLASRESLRPSVACARPTRPLSHACHGCRPSRRSRTFPAATTGPSVSRARRCYANGRATSCAPTRLPPTARIASRLTARSGNTQTNVGVW